METTLRSATLLGQATRHGEEHEQLQEVLPKNYIHPLPVQDHKGVRFRRPTLPIVGARRHSRWRDPSKRQNPNSTRYALAVAIGHIYRKTRMRLCYDYDPNWLGF